MSQAAMVLVRVLRDPQVALGLDARDWTSLWAVARAERLAGTLAHRLSGLPLPAQVKALCEDARGEAEGARTSALWEADRARAALAPLAVPVVLLKGTAYAAAGLSAAKGRAIGDCDILVPRDRLADVEAALLAAGWEWAKPDPYDDAYYRRWMHELPPLIHGTRDRMIDVHHTILPLTARPRPDAAALLADAEPLCDGLFILSAEDRVVHAACHLLADGDLSGGLRNLWDIHCLVGELDDRGWAALEERARRHGLGKAVERAVRLAAALYGTAIPRRWSRRRLADTLYVRRLTARDAWGRQTRPLTRLAFYIRSHCLRMPPAMLARHLWIKWRRG